MAWYKVVCNHGPGHQSTHTWYIEADTRADAVAQSEYDVDNGRWDWPIWKVTKVRKFKRPELERLIEKEASSLKYAEEEVKNHKRKIRALKTMRN